MSDAWPLISMVRDTDYVQNQALLVNQDYYKWSAITVRNISLPLTISRCNWTDDDLCRIHRFAPASVSPRLSMLAPPTMAVGTLGSYWAL